MSDFSSFLLSLLICWLVSPIVSANVATWISWTPEGETFPSTCDHQAVAAADNQAIYVLGGGDASEIQFNVPDLYYLNLTGKIPSWGKIDSATQPQAPIPRLGECLIVRPYTHTDNKIYSKIISHGGYGSVAGSFRYLDDSAEFDTRTGTWRELQPLTPDGLSNGMVARVWANCFWLDNSYSELAIYGGVGAENGKLKSDLDHTLDSFYWYNATLNSWREAPDPESACLNTTEVCADSLPLSDLYANATATFEQVTADLAALVRPEDVLSTIDSYRNTTNDVWKIIGDNWVPVSNDDSGCKDLCTLYARSVHYPGRLEGTRSAQYGTKEFIFGGYSCTAQGVQDGGGSCYLNTLWLYDRATNLWDSRDQPQPDEQGNYASLQEAEQASLWPSPRAYHTASILNHKIYITGGSYTDNVFTIYYYNDVFVLNVLTLLWEPISVYGSPMPKKWSHTATFIGSDLYLIGGCSPPLFYNDIHVLKIDTAPQAANMSASGPGLHSATAGQMAEFNISVLDAQGQILDWATGLEGLFDIALVNIDNSDSSHSLAVYSRATLSSTMPGVYLASFTPQFGVKFQIFVNFNGVAIPSSPFSLTLSSAETVHSASSYTPAEHNIGISKVVRDAESSFIIQTADEFGNNIAAGEGSGKVILVVNSQQIITPTVQRLSGGKLTVNYISPDISGSFSLQVWLVSNATASQAVILGAVQGNTASYGVAQISGSPFLVEAVDPLIISPSLVYFMYSITSVAIIIVLIYMFYIYKNRKVAEVKASSPALLQMTLIGCLMVLINNFFFANFSDATCRTIPFFLCCGLVLILSSLCMKSYRILSIFNSRTLKVQVLTDRRMISLVIIFVSIQLGYNVIWTIIEPLSVDRRLLNANDVLTYSTCSSSNSLSWILANICGLAAILIYAVFLAVSTRAVPTEFNESKPLGLSIYNIFITLIAGFPVLIFSQGNINATYATLSSIVVWIILFTSSLMCGVKIGRIYWPHLFSDSGETSPKPTQIFARKNTTGSANSTLDGKNMFSPANGSSGQSAFNYEGAAAKRSHTSVRKPSNAQKGGGNNNNVSQLTIPDSAGTNLTEASILVTNANALLNKKSKSSVFPGSNPGTQTLSDNVARPTEFNRTKSSSSRYNATSPLSPMSSQSPTNDDNINNNSTLVLIPGTVPSDECHIPI
jgi:hypothetical protein